MDKYTRIYVKLSKLYEMKETIAKNPNGEYKRYSEHRIAFAKIKEAVENNADFILNAIIPPHEYDAAKVVSQMRVANYCFSNTLFLHLLAKCSLANRLKIACEKKYLVPEIVERIRDCMVVFCE